MVEGQLTSTEPHQDPSDVVGFSTTAGESQRFGGSGGVGTYHRRPVTSASSLSAQVAAVCRSGYYQLRQIDVI